MKHFPGVKEFYNSKCSYSYKLEYGILNSLLFRINLVILFSLWLTSTLFACQVFFSCLFFFKSTFSKKSFKNTTKVSNSLDADQTKRWIWSGSKLFAKPESYQQMTLAVKELKVNLTDMLPVTDQRSSVLILSFNFLEINTWQLFLTYFARQTNYLISQYHKTCHLSASWQL